MIGRQGAEAGRRTPAHSHPPSQGANQSCARCRSSQRRHSWRYTPSSCRTNVGASHSGDCGREGGAARDMAHAGSPVANAAPEAAAPGELGFARLRDGGGWLADAPISSLRRSPRWLLAHQCRHRLARAAGLAGVRQRHAGAGSREALPASCAGAGPAAAPPAWRGRTPTWRPWTRTPRLQDADGERPSSWRRVSTAAPGSRQVPASAMACAMAMPCRAQSTLAGGHAGVGRSPAAAYALWPGLAAPCVAAPRT